MLTDLVMPGVDGSKLIDAIKTLSPQTPAILLSGKVRIYDRDTRADVFLPKGMYAPVELLERIRLLLVRKRGPKRAVSPEHPAAERALPEALSIRISLKRVSSRARLEPRPGAVRANRWDPYCGRGLISE